MDIYECIGTSNKINVRVGPGTEFAASGYYVNSGDKIECLQQASGWFRVYKIIRYNGNEIVPPADKTWWVPLSPTLLRFVGTTDPVPPPPPPPPPRPPPAPGPPTAIVCTLSPSSCFT